MNIYRMDRGDEMCMDCTNQSLKRNDIVLIVDRNLSKSVEGNELDMEC